MWFAGLLVPGVGSQRGQRRRLVPTEAFVGLQRDRLRQAFVALTHLRLEGAIGLALLNDEGFTARFMLVPGDGLGTNERPILFAPKTAYFLEHNAGVMILVSLMLSGGPDDTMPPMGPFGSVGWSTCSALTGFSHARDADAAGAEAEGCFSEKRQMYRMAPELREAVTTFVAAMLTLLARRVVTTLQHSVIRQDQVS
jgi:hypothetical protein